jgi:hypothetical protein
MSYVEKVASISCCCFPFLFFTIADLSVPPSYVLHLFPVAFVPVAFHILVLCLAPFLNAF